MSKNATVVVLIAIISFILGRKSAYTLDIEFDLFPGEDDDEEPPLSVAMFDAIHDHIDKIRNLPETT